jgi:GTP-binding protein
MSLAPLFKQVEFMLGCRELEQLPRSRLPEIAFAGRSNVGKSSLLNALTNRKDLARTSNTPGRTRELNFFSLDDKLLMVDMPGYGYAEAPKKEIKQWTALIRQYLSGRPNLKRVFVLIDSRHGVKPVDEEMLDMLDEVAVNYQLVLTKLDKLKKGEAEKVLAATQEVAARHGAAHPEVIATSSEKGEGIDSLRKVINSLI